MIHLHPRNAKDCQLPPAAMTEDQNRFFPRASRKIQQPCHTLILDFRLQTCERKKFCCFKPPVCGNLLQQCRKYHACSLLLNSRMRRPTELCGAREPTQGEQSHYGPRTHVKDVGNKCVLLQATEIWEQFFVCLFLPRKC